jgi:hypothetical protein
MDKTDEMLCQWLPNQANANHAIAERIRWLIDEAEDEGEPVNDVSLFALLKFFEYRPSLTVNPSGEFSAQWHFEGSSLIIRFKTDGSIQPLLRKY